MDAVIERDNLIREDERREQSTEPMASVREPEANSQADESR